MALFRDSNRRDARRCRRSHSRHSESRERLRPGVDGSISASFLSQQQQQHRIVSCLLSDSRPCWVGLTWRSGTDQRVQTSQAVNHGHHGHRHGHHDHTTTPPRPPAPALPSPGTGLWCWRRADDWAVVVERVAVVLGRRFRVVAPPLAPRSIARLSSFSAPRHVDAHTLGAIDWLRSDCPDDFEPSQTHKVGVWEINAPIFTAARRHQVHHGNVSIRKDGFPQQSSCHGNCRSTKKEGIYV